MKIVLT